MSSFIGIDLESNKESKEKVIQFIKNKLNVIFKGE